MATMRFVVAGLSLLLAVAAVASGRQFPARVSYNAQVRPILAENCFTCHGPDSAARKGNLRIDRPNRAIVAGKPASSSLLKRIGLSRADALAMPPVSTHKQVSRAQAATLSQWISEGANYEPHWSWIAPKANLPVPKVIGAPNGSPIDAFVRARLSARGLTQSPPADRATWLRRVTLDLNGIPPTPEEIDAFLSDTRPGAFERVVDRLLASPRYGATMAVPWLDLARYADSYGYQSDQLAPNWPYRDWVIESFNRNLPYDRFVTEQLAGDLLPGATVRTRLATAFQRVHRMTNEGGSVAEEWRLEGVSDRVKTIGTAFLGLTLECARCHDHKYDAITQRDYYALAAFVNSIDEYGMYDATDIVPSPSLLLPTPEQAGKLAAAKQALARAETSSARDTSALGEFLTSPKLPEALPDRIAALSLDSPQTDSAAGAKLSADLTAIDGRFGKAVRFGGENTITFPNAKFARQTPFSVAFFLNDPRRDAGGPVVVFHGSSGTDAGFEGYDLLVEDGFLTARMFRHWPGNAIAIRIKDRLPRDSWHHVAVTYDGSGRASGLAVFVDGERAKVEILRDNLIKGVGAQTLQFGHRFRDRGFKGGAVDEISVFSRALSALEIRGLAQRESLSRTFAGSSETERAAFYFGAIDDAARKVSAALIPLREAVVSAESQIAEIAVMDEMPVQRPTHVLARGAYDAPKSERNRVRRATISSLPPLPVGAPKDRLGLARWLVDGKNPLTARVQVNRLWAQFFGRGLVETVEDFGIQGSLPSHPELLDFLATDFVKTGWDNKKLVRAIVLSETYRQSSAIRPETVAKDPANVWLSRGPSGRLSAEVLRDSALFASGLLDERAGGPPVSPYQPGDLWREANTMSPAYRQSVGGDLYRRSVYSVKKRTAPLPNLLVFDQVSGEVCVARRPNTSTPLQSLVLLNDTQFVEAARVLAERLQKDAATDDTRLSILARRLAGRVPDASQRAVLRKLLSEQRESFGKNPESARALIGVGERKPDPSLDPVETASWTIVAQALMNSDLSVWKR